MSLRSALQFGGDVHVIEYRDGRIWSQTPFQVEEITDEDCRLSHVSVYGTVCNYRFPLSSLHMVKGGIAVDANDRTDVD